jgi:predicted nucleic acid-binding protein
VIFVDTSYWAALNNSRDAHHEMSQELMRTHAEGQLVTTNHVRGETWTLLRRRQGHGLAVRFLDAVQRSPRLRLVWVTETIENEALRWLRRRDEREYSFVDATSFAVMKSLRIREVFAFDGDFTAAGFIELRV